MGNNGMYIKDTYNGHVRPYGSNQHDSLRVSPDGKYLTYYNLQCGDGSGEYGMFRFCDEAGKTPEEVDSEYALESYFNIGGFDGLTEDDKKAILELQEMYEGEYLKGNYDRCKTLIRAFCILNKHLTGQTGWQIRFEGSRADELINALEEV